MSGLLVKSVGGDEGKPRGDERAGVNAPVLLGGAALTRDYAEDDLANLQAARCCTAATRSTACT
jgi:cobalamin-dependent methionine synthase I